MLSLAHLYIVYINIVYKHNILHGIEFVLLALTRDAIQKRARTDSVQDRVCQILFSSEGVRICAGDDGSQHWYKRKVAKVFSGERS